MSSRGEKTLSGSRGPCRAPAALGAAAAEGLRLFYGEEDAARDWAMSANGLALARQRGELEGAFILVGRRVLYSRLAPRLRSLGLGDPEALGRFCRGAGIRDLAGLLAWLAGPEAKHDD